MPGCAGDRVNFVIVDDSGTIETNLYFEGRVSGDAIEGMIKRGIGSDREADPVARHARCAGSVEHEPMQVSLSASLFRHCVVGGCVCCWQGARRRSKPPDVPYVSTPWNVVAAMLDMRDASTPTIT